MAAPMTMPISCEIMPSVTTLNTKTQRLDLRRDPTEVGDHDARGQHFDRAVVAHAEEVAEGRNGGNL